MRISRLATGVAAILLVTGAAACTSDDDTGDTQAAGTSSSEGGRVDAWCEVAVDLESAFAGLPWIERAPPDERQDGLAEFRATVERHLSRAEALVPEEVAADSATAVEEIRDFLRSGNPEAIEGPEFQQANDRLDQYMLAECGYEHVEVTGTDYAYEGLPDTMPAGVVAITLTNQGAEEHEMFIARLDDDVTLSFEEVLRLAAPEDQFFSMVRPAGGEQARPGESATVFIRMDEGRYGVLCSVPQGTTGDTEGRGAPHVALGEFAEFTVG